MGQAEKSKAPDPTECHVPAIGTAETKIGGGVCGTQTQPCPRRVRLHQEVQWALWAMAIESAYPAKDYNAGRRASEQNAPCARRNGPNGNERSEIAENDEKMREPENERGQ